jgi:hypothetical protein
MDIIFYQDKQPDWFAPCLESVKTNSPSCKLHFLDDKMYLAATVLFDSSFINKSTNPEYFEKACIRRWIVINEYVKQNNIQHFVVMDWDILVLCDLEKETERFWYYDFTYQNKMSIGFSMWNSAAALQDLVDMIMKVYTDRDSEISKNMLGIYDALQRAGHPGGVTDMAFSSELITSNKYKTLDTYDILPGDICFDNNMTTNAGGWRMENGPNVKRIHFLHNMAFCHNDTVQRDVRMMVLHFAGHSRNMIFDYWKRSRE